jgi:hypothetical protein
MNSLFFFLFFFQHFFFFFCFLFFSTSLVFFVVFPACISFLLVSFSVIPSVSLSASSTLSAPLVVCSLLAFGPTLSCLALAVGACPQWLSPFLPMQGSAAGAQSGIHLAPWYPVVGSTWALAPSGFTPGIVGALTPYGRDPSSRRSSTVPRP